MKNFYFFISMSSTARLRDEHPTHRLLSSVHAPCDDQTIENIQPHRPYQANPAYFPLGNILPGVSTQPFPSEPRETYLKPAQN